MIVVGFARCPLGLQRCGVEDEGFPHVSVATLNFIFIACRSCGHVYAVEEHTHVRTYVRM